MRRLAPLVLALLLVDAPAALAAAGGGSSGFGGGGGGGGGGFSGGGGSSSGTSSGGGVATWIFIAVALFLIFGLGFVREWRRRRRRDARVVRTRAAATEAAQDDAAFDPDTLCAQAGSMFVAMQSAWSQDDRKALAELCGPELMVEWQRRLDDFAAKGWRNSVKVLEGPHVYYVGLVNSEQDAEDRAVVLVEAKLRDVVVDAKGNAIKRKDSDGTQTELREYWTLAKRAGVWRLASIEQQKEGEHNLSSELVASPWSGERVHEDAVLETAAADAAGAPVAVAALVDLDYAGDGRKAALDLSLVDGRFAPDVLETSARRAVAAWAEAVDGPDDALERVARPAAIAALLHPTGDDAVRRVVRGPELRRMTLVTLDEKADPPRMVVELELAGARYLENRDTVAVVDGSRDTRTRWTERWSFDLVGDAEVPWVVAAAA